MRRLLYLAISALCASPVLAQDAPAVQKDVRSGAEVFRHWCVECHGPGPRPGTLALQKRYQGGVPAALEERSDIGDGLIRFAVRHGMSFMPFFRKTEVSDQDLDAICAYLRSTPEVRAQLLNASSP